MVHQILKNYLNSNITLYREVDHKIRYYSLKLYPTLFEEVILERSFGSVKNKKPTRVINEYFSHLEDAALICSRIYDEKVKKGYFTKAS